MLFLAEAEKAYMIGKRLFLAQAQLSGIPIRVYMRSGILL